MDIDLNQFCSTDHVRYNIHAPFTIGEWTYATDGRFAVRVPKRDGFDNPKPPRADKIFAEKADFTTCTEPLPAMDLPIPEITKTECEYCGGRGTDHECPSCTCKCSECGGSGAIIEREKISVRVKGIAFDVFYIRMLQQLNSVLIPEAAPENAPMPFTFDGGEGLVMPLKNGLTHPTHIEPEAP